MRRNIWLAALFYLLLTGAVWALPFAGHYEIDKDYMGDVPELEGRIANSSVIDRVPWRRFGGGWNHRALWGHTEEWFYKGRIPKAEAIQDIRATLMVDALRAQNPGWSEDVIDEGIKRIYQLYRGGFGRERVLKELRQYMTERDAKAMAEQLYGDHISPPKCMQAIKAKAIEVEWRKGSFDRLERQALEAKASKIFEEATSLTGQERITKELMRIYPSLTKKEAMARAEQLYAAHIVGDSGTPEGKKYMDEAFKERMQGIVNSPSLEALSASNKIAIAEAMNNQEGNFSSAAFVGQYVNFERLKAEWYVREKGVTCYNPASPNDIGITVDGQNYILKSTPSDIRSAIRRLPKGAKILLPDDEYKKFINNTENADILDYVLQESQVTGNKDTLGLQREKILSLVERDREEILREGKARLAAFEREIALKQRLRAAVPYAVGGAMMALMENWELLKDAYDGNATWAQALTRTGIDFAGYTVTPMLMDGILGQLGDKLAIVAPLKDAGMGYALGFFCWNAGKEFLSYQLGDISYDEFTNRMKQRSFQAGREIAMIPVNMLVCKLVAVAGGPTFLVPIVIIGGSFAIQRAQAWYEEKRWQETVYIEDVKAILGEDLMNQFTLLSPERRANLAAPERRPNLANPSRRPNLAEPVRRPNLANP